MMASFQKVDKTYKAGVTSPFDRDSTSPAAPGFPHILGDSASLLRIFEMIRIVAPSDATVLISGETGTGKELVAHAIHSSSARSKGPFVKVNCAAMPAGLLESEFFGHERGAFTGACARRIGRFEAANRGTLFLDEVGEIPLELQAKLLRALQEREFERLGGSCTLKSDIRVIAATNCDLGTMVGQRQFRADLFYRLNVFPLELPPLRERREDIPGLVRYFVEQFGRRLNKKIETIPAAAMEALVRHEWPGNVRELQNAIERALLLSPGAVLVLPGHEREPLSTGEIPKRGRENLRSALYDIERQRILRALEQTHGKVSGPNGAATLLGMKRTTLMSRMRKLDIAAARRPLCQSCAAAGANS